MSEPGKDAADPGAAPEPSPRPSPVATPHARERVGAPRPARGAGLKPSGRVKPVLNMVLAYGLSAPGALFLAGYTAAMLVYPGFQDDWSRDGFMLTLFLVKLYFLIVHPMLASLGLLLGAELDLRSIRGVLTGGKGTVHMGSMIIHLVFYAVLLFHVVTVLIIRMS